MSDEHAEPNPVSEAALTNEAAAAAPDPLFPIDEPRRLSRDWITVRRLGALVSSAMMAGMILTGVLGLWIFSSVLAERGWLILPAAALLIGVRFILAWVWPPIEWTRRSYQVDDTGVEFQHGVLFRTVMTVPRSRIQHTEVTQGPIQRRFGLSTFVMHTAGSSSSSVALGGLESEVAYGMRDYLLSHESDSAPDDA